MEVIGGWHVPGMDEAESRAWLGLMRVVELLPAALDAQLQRDSGMTHFEFMVLSMLRFAPERTLRMTTLARDTNATLPRLSHVCSRLEARGMVSRATCATDRRATNVTLTPSGARRLTRATPGHIATARRLVIDALSPAQLEALAAVTGVLGRRLGSDACHDLAVEDGEPGVGLDRPDAPAGADPVEGGLVREAQRERLGRVGRAKRPVGP
jgi:DNA-binding MarR family transcriptional regulator